MVDAEKHRRLKHSVLGSDYSIIKGDTLITDDSIITPEGVFNKAEVMESIKNSSNEEKNRLNYEVLTDKDFHEDLLAIFDNEEVKREMKEYLEGFENLSYEEYLERC